MNSLRDLFHKPVTTPIGGVDFIVHKLGLEQFDDALELGKWIETLDDKSDVLPQLEALKAGSPIRMVLQRLIAGCLSLPASAVALPPVTAGNEMRLSDPRAPRRLEPEDVQDMPAVMAADAAAVLLEINTDFFFQTLPTLVGRINRIKSTGLALLSNLQAQGTAPTGSAA